MPDGNIEARIQKLEDIEEIKKLTAHYATYVNKGWNGKVVDLDKLPQVFTESVRWTSGTKSASGRDSVVEMLKVSTAQIDFAMHSFSNPIIEVEGDRAMGQWLLWVGVKTGDIANEAFQSEEITYARTAEGWRIQSIDLHFGTMLNS